MPSTRFNCDTCELRGHESTNDAESQLTSAKAVGAYALGADEPADISEELDLKSKACADAIVSGKCTMWQKAGKSGRSGFIHKDPNYTGLLD